MSSAAESCFLLPAYGRGCGLSEDAFALWPGEGLSAPGMPHEEAKDPVRVIEGHDEDVWADINQRRKLLGHEFLDHVLVEDLLDHKHDLRGVLDADVGLVQLLLDVVLQASKEGEKTSSGLSASDRPCLYVQPLRVRLPLDKLGEKDSQAWKGAGTKREAKGATIARVRGEFT